MSSEKNLQRLESPDLLELPPAYDEVGTSSQTSFNEKNKKELNSRASGSDGITSERNTNENSIKSTDRGFHPASFLFGIPIIGMLARKVMELEHRMNEDHHHYYGHQGHHKSYWGHGYDCHGKRSNRHQRKMERRERRCNRKMERDLARHRKRCC